MTERVRTQFVLPREMLAEFDRRVPPRKRSEAIAALIAEWLRRERAKEVADMAGFIKAEDHPEWATDEDVYSWVRALRNEYRDHDLPDPA